MNAGELTERITLQYSTKASDGAGGFTETWIDHATIWAKSWTVSSGELDVAMKINMVRIQKFGIWYRAKILPSWRIVFGNRYFDITSVDPDERREFLYLTCKEIGRAFN